MDTELRGAPRRLYRSTRGRMVAGVSAGLADYIGIDVTVVRLLWIVAAFVTGPVAPLLYLAGWLLMPREDELTTLL
jgi:phage shock protein C